MGCVVTSWQAAFEGLCASYTGFDWISGMLEWKVWGWWSFWVIDPMQCLDTQKARGADLETGCIAR